MNANHVLITLSCVTGGLLATTSPRCDPGQYYDPITGSCHPCSDCSDGRPGNIYCKKECKGDVLMSVFISFYSNLICLIFN